MKAPLDLHYTYLIFGRKVLSSVPLGKLAQKQFKKAEIVLKVGPAKRPRNHFLWYHYIYANRRSKAASFAKSPGRYIIRLHGTGDFIISHQGSKITCHPHPSSKLSEVAALFVSQIMPLVLSLGRNCLVFHACGVRIGDSCLMILGPQGFGKSTLAAAFVRRGYSLLSDDVLPIQFKRGIGFAVPGVPEIRLGKATAGLIARDSRVDSLLPVFAKTRIGVEFAFCTTLLPLGRIFVLGPLLPRHRGVRLRHLPLTESWTSLLENCFRLNFTDPAPIRAEFQLLANLVQKKPLTQIDFGRQKENLPAAVKAILQSAEV